MEINFYSLHTNIRTIIARDSSTESRELKEELYIIYRELVKQIQFISFLSVYGTVKFSCRGLEVYSRVRL